MHSIQTFSYCPPLCALALAAFPRKAQDRRDGPPIPVAVDFACRAVWSDPEKRIESGLSEWEGANVIKALCAVA